MLIITPSQDCLNNFVLAKYEFLRYFCFFKNARKNKKLTGCVTKALNTQDQFID